jgi:hypothetical protein
MPNYRLFGQLKLVLVEESVVCVDWMSIFVMPANERLHTQLLPLFQTESDAEARGKINFSGDGAWQPRIAWKTNLSLR